MQPARPARRHGRLPAQAAGGRLSGAGGEGVGNSHGGQNRRHDGRCNPWMRGGDRGSGLGGRGGGRVAISATGNCGSGRGQWQPVLGDPASEAGRCIWCIGQVRYLSGICGVTAFCSSGCNGDLVREGNGRRWGWSLSRHHSFPLLLSPPFCSHSWGEAKATQARPAHRQPPGKAHSPRASRSRTGAFRP